MLIDNADVTDADAVAAAGSGRGRIGFVCVVYSFGQFRWFARTHLLYYLLNDERLL